MNKEALLIIDMQNDYFPGGANELVGAEKASQNAKAILITIINKRTSFSVTGTLRKVLLDSQNG